MNIINMFFKVKYVNFKMQAKELKTVVLGPRIGKTKWIKSLFNSNCQTAYSTTVGVQVTPYEMGSLEKDGTSQIYRLNLWEVGSQYRGLGKEYCKDVDIAIIFMDSEEKYKEYEKWVSNIPKVYVNDILVQNIIQEIWQIILCNKKYKSNL